MSNALLTAISVERFKSHRHETSVHLKPLTVFVGPNNSGKSSIVQALLLLKQTLEFPRVDVPLHLEGVVDALSIRELTFGWPAEETFAGPSIKLRWRSDVDAERVRNEVGSGALDSASSRAETSWISCLMSSSSFSTETQLSLAYGLLHGRLVLYRIRLESFALGSPFPRIAIVCTRKDDGSYDFAWNGVLGKSIDIDLDHFIPFISINRRNVGPRDRQRAWVTAFSAVLLQPLEDLKDLLKRFNYLSSTRAIQPSMYRFSSIAPDGVGVSGESAAQLLQANRDKRVFFIPPRLVSQSEVPDVIAHNLQSAVSEVLLDMGIEQPISIEEIGDLGFRLLFGQANLQHVGRGLTYLLPIVEMGLFSDPTLLVSIWKDRSIADTNYSLCAFEEPEAHLHPKIQSKLAEMFVSLALARRQVIVETHSDHMVRRLRSLIAQAPRSSQMEGWLANSVSVVEVEQHQGVSALRESDLRENGDLEIWPKEFMDQAQVMEQQIYVAGLDKEDRMSTSLPDVVHSGQDEPDEPFD
jgi:predicted ATPase